ncbi:MAG: hypothetical protein ABUT39_19850 [Acidobacteriota bacterium]
MADGNKSKESQKTAASASPVTELPREGGVVGASPGGTLTTSDASELTTPTGGILLATDDPGKKITGELGAGAPAFGSVLSSIGTAVATSQKALDKGVVDAVKKLSEKKIKVVTQVVQELNDDGIPDTAKTKLITNEVSVLNYFTPTFHEWKTVELSMDLTVGAFHAEQGVQFNAHQESSSIGGGGAWGFGGWFDFSHASSDQSVKIKNQQDVAWSSGQVQLVAQLGPRNTGKFPVPASVEIGPQIYVTQGAVTEQKTADVVTSRSVDVLIELRKRSGEPMQQGVNIVLESGTLLPSFATGSSTDGNGRVKVKLTRSLSAAAKGFEKFPLSVSLGSRNKSFTVML